MPHFITKTYFQRREYFCQLDSRKGNKVLQEILTEIRQRKEKKTFDVLTLKGFNSRFQRQMNKIQRVRNNRNKKCRSKWDTFFHQEKAKLK